MGKKSRWLSLLVLLVGFGLVAIFLFFPQNRLKLDSDSLPTIRIYTYNSFMGIYGPGPKLKEEFEKICGCRVKYINGGDSGVMIERLKMLDHEAVDLLVGIDQFGIKKALSDLNWKKVNQIGKDWVDPVKSFGNPYIIPFDWAPMTILFRDIDPVLSKSFKEFLDEVGDQYRVLSLQDPRVSTPGLQFLFWLNSLNLNTNPWAKMKDGVHSVSPSWSTSYGLFKKKRALWTFSYLTSAAYHWRVEKNFTYKPAKFSDGHPFQVEFVGIPERCKSCDLAQQFIELLLSQKGQKIVMEGNFMLPVIKSVPLSSGFDQLPDLPLLPVSKMKEFVEQRSSLVKKWLQSYRGSGP